MVVVDNPYDVAANDVVAILNREGRESMLMNCDGLLSNEAPMMAIKIGMVEVSHAIAWVECMVMYGSVV